MLQKKLKAGNMMRFIGHLRKEYPGVTWERIEHPATKKVFYNLNFSDPKTQIKVELVEVGALVNISSEFFHFDRNAYTKLENYIIEYFK